MFNAIKKFFTGDKPETTPTAAVSEPAPYKVETPAPTVVEVVPAGTEASISAPVPVVEATKPVVEATKEPAKKVSAKPKAAPAKKQTTGQSAKAPAKPRATATKIKKPLN